MSDFDTWYDRLSTTSALPTPAPSERLITEEILAAARIEGIEDIGDLRYAVLWLRGLDSHVPGTGGRSYIDSQKHA